MKAGACSKFYRLGSAGIPRTDIYAILGRSRTAGDVNMTLSVLKENELADCVVTRIKGSKKPTEVWFSKRHANKFINSQFHTSP